MITDLSRANHILKSYYEKKDLAFIFGNGINRYANNTNSNISWNDMLLRVWDSISDKTLSDIAKGITLTEFYNIMEFEAGSAKVVREKTVDIIKSWTPSQYENNLEIRLKEIDCPVLTTNFDGNIEQGLVRNKMSPKGFSDYYPWNVYYSDNKLNNPLDGFGVWHINGMKDYPRSLRLSLSEYINLTAKARGYIHSGDALDSFDKKNIINWRGYHTWLHLIFNCNLCIMGLSLDEQETFLRWLLLERIKYFKKFRDRKKKGWFVCHKDDIQNDGKRMFLEYLGFEIICLSDYKDIYEDLLDVSI